MTQHIESTLKKSGKLKCVTKKVSLCSGLLVELKPKMVVQGKKTPCISKTYTTRFFMNEAYCGDASGNHIAIIPIIRVRNPGIMAVVKHHLKLAARCMTKQEYDETRHYTFND